MVDAVLHCPLTDVVRNESDRPADLEERNPARLLPRPDCPLRNAEEARCVFGRPEPLNLHGHHNRESDESPKPGCATDDGVSRP